MDCYFIEYASISPRTISSTTSVHSVSYPTVYPTAMYSTQSINPTCHPCPKTKPTHPSYISTGPSPGWPITTALFSWGVWGLDVSIRLLGHNCVIYIWMMWSRLVIVPWHRIPHSRGGMIIRSLCPSGICHVRRRSRSGSSMRVWVPGIWSLFRWWSKKMRRRSSSSCPKTQPIQ